MKIKKILKITAIVLLLFIGLLAATPVLFKGKIIEIIKTNVNKNLNAKLDFTDTDISLFRNFPKASVKVSDISLINYEPFVGDTLFAAKEVNLTMSLSELFNSANEPMKIDYFSVDGANVAILVDEQGNANYDIAKQTDITEDKTASETVGFNLSVQGYDITNSTFLYKDAGSGISFRLDSLQHKGSGDLSAATSKLTTNSTALVSMEMDSTNYLNKNPIKLDAVIGIDLENSKYTFLDNELLINQLPLVFDGFYQMNTDNSEVDITFKTPSSDFKNFLAVIPEAYSKNIENVQTSGNFEVSGEAKGIIDDEHIPTFDIKIVSNDAMFKYPDLPKAVQNIKIDTEIKNETGITNDTEVDIRNLSFTIDQDVFNGNARITNLIENPNVNAKVNGTINLGNVSKAYPVDLDIPLSGILKANIATAFDMNSIEKEQYQNTTNSGSLSLSGFKYSSDAMANPLAIETAALTFNPTTVSINTFKAKSGKTDIEATGTIKNLLGYMFNDELLKGTFNLNSNTFSLNDFMVEEETAQTNTTTEAKTTQTTNNSDAQIKIPAFLDATVAVNANTVLYDNLTLKNVKGTLNIKDEAATLNNVSSNLLGGSVQLNGSVSTKASTPKFNMDLGINSFDIAQSFTELELFQSLAPIAQAIQGKLTSTLKLSGNLDENLAPDLTTLTGNALAELLTTEINTEDSKALSLLSNNLSFIDLKNLSLKDIKTALAFENGRVTVKPFTLAYKDIAIEVDGSHGFDKSMSYNLTFDVPAKYLGSDVSALLSKLNNSDVQNTKIPIKALVSGSFTSPKVSTDLKQSVTNFTNQIIEKQKEQLINNGKDKVKETIGNFLGGNTTATDSTKTTTTKDSTKTKTEETVKNTVKNTLNNLFNKNKKE